jgi:hypothetical protein
MQHNHISQLQLTIYFYKFKKDRGKEKKKIHVGSFRSVDCLMDRDPLQLLHSYYHVESNPHVSHGAVKYTTSEELDACLMVGTNHCWN